MATKQFVFTVTLETQEERHEGKPTMRITLSEAETGPIISTGTCGGSEENTSEQFMDSFNIHDTLFWLAEATGHVAQAAKTAQMIAAFGLDRGKPSTEA